MHVKIYLYVCHVDKQTTYFIMGTNNTKEMSNVTAMANICAMLNDKVKFNNIGFSQILPCEYGDQVNGLMFVAKKYGVYFYTSKHSFESNICQLQSTKLETLVCIEGSKTMFKIS